MKKLLMISLLVLPMTATAASSVRVLGTNSNTGSVAAQKITPTKSVSSIGSNTTPRVGSLRAAPKLSSNTGVVPSSSSRFPIISTAHSYNSVTTPTSSGTVVPASVDVDAIVDAVTQRIENNYYSKTEVYNNNEFKQAVQDVDDPRIDAIKVGSRPVHSATLPSDYVYIWIEQ